MRVLVVLAVAGCGGSSTNPADVPADHRLHDLGSETSQVKYLRYGGKQVEAADITQIADTIGLPLSGTADIVIDVTIPKTRGQLDYTKATGSFNVACTKCKLGNDRAKLKLDQDSVAAFDVGGLLLGHLTFEQIEVSGTIANGKLASSLKLTSPDIEIDATLGFELAVELEASALSGCIRFRPTEGLRKRQPKTYDMISLTGANLGADRKYHIALEGTVDNIKRLAKECGP